MLVYEGGGGEGGGEAASEELHLTGKFLVDVDSLLALHRGPTCRRRRESRAVPSDAMMDCRALLILLPTVLALGPGGTGAETVYVDKFTDGVLVCS